MIGGLNKDGSPIPVRGGYAAQGSAIHHARFYSWEDQRGKLQYGMLRVYAADLLKAYGKKQDLMTCELTDESYSWRYADQKMRAAQHEGILHLIGVIQQRDEIEVDLAQLTKQSGGVSDAVQALYRSEVGHETVTFSVAGFESPTVLKLAMSSLAPEGLISNFEGALKEIREKYSDAETVHRKLNDLVRKASKLYAFSDIDWISAQEAILRPEARERMENINKQVNGYWRPSVNVLFKLGFRLNIRDAFGNIRTNWSGSGHMPVSWSINYEGENAVEP
jgi:hypothetical protein